MLYKVNERVRVIPRNKNEPWAGHSGLVVGYDEERGYKLRFPQGDFSGFLENELELDTTQLVPMDELHKDYPFLQTLSDDDLLKHYSSINEEFDGEIVFAIGVELKYRGLHEALFDTKPN